MKTPANRGARSARQDAPRNGDQPPAAALAEPPPLKPGLDAPGRPGAAPEREPRGRHRRKRRHHYHRSGYHVLKKVVRQPEETWLAELGDVGQALQAWRSAIVDLAAKSKLLLDSVDRWMLAQPSLINKSRRQLFAVVLQRQQLADALARYLGQLGLKRRAQRVSVTDYLQGRTRER